MPLNECCCRYCTKRKVGCHGYCVDYKKWARVQKQISNNEREMRKRTYHYVDWNGSKRFW